MAWTQGVSGSAGSYVWRRLWIAIKASCIRAAEASRSDTGVGSASARRWTSLRSREFLLKKSGAAHAVVDERVVRPLWSRRILTEWTRCDTSNPHPIVPDSRRSRASGAANWMEIDGPLRGLRLGGGVLALALQLCCEFSPASFRIDADRQASGCLLGARRTKELELKPRQAIRRRRDDRSESRAALPTVHCSWIYHHTSAAALVVIGRNAPRRAINWVCGALNSDLLDGAPPRSAARQGRSQKPSEPDARHRRSRAR